ncbi:MAG: pyruvate dehydrogenase complex dihydrolipoamide acetyltransferase [Rhodobacteraceae bacterium]|nr:pyruvate dehydrogenase complex dihydrolipoamide acetyltransferase [Paracoccaceae bacterium]
MATQILMPALSPTMEEGTLSKWCVQEGDTVEPGDLLAEIETDKATMELEADNEGTITKLIVLEGTKGIKVNAPIAEISSGDEPSEPTPQKVIEKKESIPVVPPQEKQEASTAKPVKSILPQVDRVFASPLARRLAQNNNISLSALSGTGPKGRVVKRDIEKFLSQSPQVAKPTATIQESLGFEQVAKIYQTRAHEVIELQGMRRAIATRLTESKQTIPHFYLRREISLDALLQLRAKINDYLAPSRRKVSINDFIIAAVAKGLQAVPGANAVWAAGKIIQLKSSDVAVAVAVDEGLFTPVIMDAQDKSLVELSREMKDLAQRARNKKLSPVEYIGGSITISNLGMYGVENFDAIINPPHASILAVGAGIKKTVVKQDGSIGIETKMSVTLSVDHRIVDGAVGANFLAEIVKHLESPIGIIVD